MTNEEQGAEEAQEEGGEQDIAESQVIGLNHEDILMLHKEPQNQVVTTQKHRAVQARAIPKESLKARKVTTLERQQFLLLFGYSWTGRWVRCSAPEEKADSAFQFYEFISGLFKKWSFLLSLCI